MTTTETYAPIAGANAISHPDAAAYHQRWLIVDDSDRWFSDTQRLAKIELNIIFGYLALQAPGMLRLDIPLDVIEDDDSVRRQIIIDGQAIDVVDEGEVAATWATACLGLPCRLVKIHPDATPVKWPAQ